MALSVTRLDKGAPDIVRADDAELEGQARLLGKADGGWHTAVGHGNDEVGIARRLGYEGSDDEARTAFQEALARHRAAIREVYDRLFPAA